MYMKAYLNGRIIPVNQLKINVADRGFLYGDGVFESLRTFGRRPFLQEEHLRRLLSAAKFLSIKTPALPALKPAVSRVIAANRFREYYIKLILTRGEAAGHGLDPGNCRGKPNLIVLAEELREPDPGLYRRGWSATISSLLRANLPTARVKSLCYLDNILAKAEATKAKANEA